ncbi:MAG: DMT family transporter [Planctomycetota bacterium]
MPNQPRGPLFALLTAVALFGLGTPVLKWLVAHGGHLGSVQQDAISYCNVLFVGNLCSALLVALYFRPAKVAPQTLELIKTRPLPLLLNTLFANVLAPTLVIYALEETTATTVVLLLQADVMFHALIGRVTRGKSISSRALAGFGLIGAGVVVLSLYASGGMFCWGSIYTLLAAFCRAVGASTAKQTLADQRLLPAFLILRNLLGAVVFYALAMQMFGPGHFADAFLPGLWELMVVYAAVVIVAGQFSWYHAITRLPSEVVCAMWTLTPVFGLIFAFLLLGERPTPVQWVSVVLILAGLAVANSAAHARLKAADSAAGAA